MTITFTQSFQLIDKQGVIHTFTLGGTIEQKTEIAKTCAESIKKAIGGGWTVVPTSLSIPPGPQLSPDPNTTTETIMAEQLIVTADENGTHFKIKGGKYKQFGVPIYPEYVEALGIDPDLRPGAHVFKKKVVIQCNKNGEKTSCKVIALG